MRRAAVILVAILAVAGIGVGLAEADPGTSGSQIVVNCVSPSVVTYGPATYDQAVSWDTSAPWAGGCWEIRPTSSSTTTTTTVPPTTTVPVSKYCQKHPGHGRKCKAAK